MRLHACSRSAARRTARLFGRALACTGQGRWRTSAREVGAGNALGKDRRRPRGVAGGRAVACRRAPEGGKVVGGTHVLGVPLDRVRQRVCAPDAANRRPVFFRLMKTSGKVTRNATCCLPCSADAAAASPWPHAASRWPRRADCFPRSSARRPAPPPPPPPPLKGWCPVKYPAGPNPSCIAAWS